MTSKFTKFEEAWVHDEVRAFDLWPSEGINFEDCDGGCALLRAMHREHGPPCRAYDLARIIQRCFLDGHPLHPAGVQRLISPRNTVV